MSIIEILPPETTAFSRTFEGNGTEFSAERDALAFLHTHGFSVGAVDISCIRGVMHGRWNVAKWSRLSNGERDGCHGAVVGNARTGPLTVMLFCHAPLEALDAIFADARSGNVVARFKIEAGNEART